MFSNFLRSLLSYAFPFQFQQLLISQYFRNHLYLLLDVILIHILVKVVCHLKHSLVDFCNLLILGKSFDNVDEPLEFLLPDAILILLCYITPSPSKVLDAVIGVVILPELHQCLLSVFLSCTNRLGKPPKAVGLKSFHDSLTHWLDQRHGVWREKHCFDTVMKITNKRRMSGSIIDNKQNLERSITQDAFLLATLAADFVLLAAMMNKKTRD
ncbi:uncharacterized protein [Equus asinus]|uniref:uncharacterized protein n=1 Tax=Equus asinus TaxID=9793 RepID=UPI0038F71640